MYNKPKLPCIITDINHLITTEKYAISDISRIMQYLLHPLKFNDIDNEFTKEAEVKERELLHIPFINLSNIGDYTEKQYAMELNKTLSLDNSSFQLTEKHIIVNHTPFINHAKQYQDKLVLIAGHNDNSIKSITEHMGLKYYITVDEYCALYPFLVPNSRRKPEDSLILKPIIKQRLDIKPDDNILDEPLQIHAIIILNVPLKWDESVQIICDLLSSKNGIISNKFPKPEESHIHIPIYAFNEDIKFKGNYKLPRLHCGAFIGSLKYIYKLIYKRDLEINYYGNTTLPIIINFIKQFLQEKYNEYDISTIYMIGNNSALSYKQIRQAEWKFISISKQRYLKNDNELIDQIDYYTCENFKQAIELIYNLEGIDKHYNIL